MRIITRVNFFSLFMFLIFFSRRNKEVCWESVDQEFARKLDIDSLDHIVGIGD